jgi:hypothetical protein
LIGLRNQHRLDIKIAVHGREDLIACRVGIDKKSSANAWVNRRRGGNCKFAAIEAFADSVYRSYLVEVNEIRVGGIVIVARNSRG